MQEVLIIIISSPYLISKAKLASHPTNLRASPCPLALRQEDGVCSARHSNCPINPLWVLTRCTQEDCIFIALGPVHSLVGEWEFPQHARQCAQNGKRCHLASPRTTTPLTHVVLCWVTTNKLQETVHFLFCRNPGTVRTLAVYYFSDYAEIKKSQVG